MENQSEDTPPPSTEETNPTKIHIFQDLDSSSNTRPIYPPTAHVSVLFHFYFKNVDPVCKIIHKPTVDKYYSDIESIIDPSTQRFKFRSLEPVTFAAYFAAVNSMSEKECLAHLDESRDVLLTRYMRGAETALIQANFLNSLEMPTLQAFVIYIIRILLVDPFGNGVLPRTTSSIRDCNLSASPSV